jgi:FMN phosphatase YigB (HAD superfamily)
MSLTLLFDLDDTLLDTNLDAFVPAYFQALSSHLADRVPPTDMLRALISGTNLMNESEDPTRTLKEVFDAEFYSKLGIPKGELTDAIEHFYDEIFPALEEHTNRRPEAVELVEWAHSCGYRIAIATDPLFPRKATQHRLRWAGFDLHQFELVSSYRAFSFQQNASRVLCGGVGAAGLA